MNSKEAFEAALTFTLKAEGGYSNDPRDSGGSTYHGITQQSLNSWLHSHVMPAMDVRDLTDEQVHDFYQERFWNDPKLDMLADIFPKIAIAVFDFSVNIYYVRAIATLQRLIATVPDGHLGPRTCHALKLGVESIGGEDVMIGKYQDARRAWYKENSQEVFLHGLLNRVDNLDAYLAGLSSMDIATIGG